MNVETIARAALADFLGGSPDEVAFGADFLVSGVR